MYLNLFSEETLRGPILVGECLPPPQRPLCIVGRAGAESLRVMSWYPHLKLMFSGLCKNICLKESEDWRKAISNKIIVTLVTQGLPSSFPARPVA